MVRALRRMSSMTRIHAGSRDIHLELRNQEDFPIQSHQLSLQLKSYQESNLASEGCSHLYVNIHGIRCNIDLAIFAGCTWLRGLDLRACRDIQDVSALSTCTNLQQLDLSDTYADLHGITTCSLQHLTLRNFKGVLDLSLLPRSSLEHLNLR